MEENVKDKFFESIDDSLWMITNIEKISNGGDFESVWQEFPDQQPEIWFHGTKSWNKDPSDEFFNNGLKIKESSSQQRLGRGVYLGDAKRVIEFAYEPEDSFEKRIFACSILRGNEEESSPASEKRKHKYSSHKQETQNVGWEVLVRHEEQIRCDYIITFRIKPKQSEEEDTTAFDILFG